MMTLVTAPRRAHVACVLAALILLVVVSGCGRKKDPIVAAKDYFRSNPGTGNSDDIADPKYLPTEERLKRRQDRIRSALANPAPTVDAR